ncbi:MAG TPA: SCO family protein [Candidatus Angelobacter sp.]|nr:SCO family protein [Candidatus Angelobacter sp.]
MPDISRRKFVSLAAAAPLAASPLLAGFPVGAAFGKVPPAPAALTLSDKARQRIQKYNLPNISLISHEGKQVHFYDDLVKDKAVTLNFFFANCDEICPLVTANLATVQKLLGKQVGRDIHMYSFTLKPAEDTVSVIRQYRQKFGAGPGWTFFTAKPDDMEKLRRAIGFSYPDPAIDADKTQHIGNVRYGNEPLMLWSACPGMAHAHWIAETLEWMVHPEQNRVQAP